MERLCTTNIEHELRFLDWRKRNNVEFLLFDLDDTLCPTSKVYDDKIFKCVKIIAGEKFDFDKVSKDFHQTNNRLYEINSVNPDKYNHVVKDMRTRWNFSDDTENAAIDVLMATFQTPYKLFDGVDHMLGFLNKTNTDFGIVTHANREWTWKKFNWFGLDKFMSWDDIFVVDENRHKTAESWAHAVKYFNIDSAKCLVVGDSPRTDMCASQVGFKHLFLVGSDEKRWVVFKADLPEGVVKIHSAADIIHIGCCFQ